MESGQVWTCVLAQNAPEIINRMKPSMLSLALACSTNAMMPVSLQLLRRANIQAPACGTITPGGHSRRPFHAARPHCRLDSGGSVDGGSSDGGVVGAAPDSWRPEPGATLGDALASAAAALAAAGVPEPEVNADYLVGRAAGLDGPDGSDGKRGAAAARASEPLKCAAAASLAALVARRCSREPLQCVAGSEGRVWEGRRRGIRVERCPMPCRELSTIGPRTRLHDFASTKTDLPRIIYQVYI